MWVFSVVNFLLAAQLVLELLAEADQIVPEGAQPYTFKRRFHIWTLYTMADDRSRMKHHPRPLQDALEECVSRAVFP